MTGSEMREIRRRLNMDRLQFARLIGYTGTDRNDVTRIRIYESGKRQVPLYIARLIWLILQLQEVKKEPWMWEECDFLMPGPIQWPQWPGYDFDHDPDHEHQKEAPDGAEFY